MKHGAVFLFFGALLAVVFEVTAGGVSQVGFSIYKDKEEYEQAKEGIGGGNNKVIVTYAINHPGEGGAGGDISLTPSVLPQFSRHDQHQKQISSYVAQKQGYNRDTGGGSYLVATGVQPPARTWQQAFQQQPAQRLNYANPWQQAQNPQKPSMYYAAPVPSAQPQRTSYPYVVPQQEMSHRYYGNEPQMYPASPPAYSINAPVRQQVPVVKQPVLRNPATLTSNNIIGLEQRLKIANARKSFVPVYNQDIQTDTGAALVSDRNNAGLYNEALDQNIPLQFF